MSHSRENQKHYVIDFDHTIINGHSHNTIMEIMIKEKNEKKEARTTEEQYQLIMHMKPVGSDNPDKAAKDWLDTIVAILKRGDTVSIASFSYFGPVIDLYLRRVIKLDNETMKNIHIEAWLPDNPSTADKNNHIEKILIARGIKDSASPDQIILIDDGLTNINAAKKVGYRTIIADTNKIDDVTHIEILKQIAKYPNDIDLVAPSPANSKPASLISNTATPDAGSGTPYEPIQGSGTPYEPMQGSGTPYEPMQGSGTPYEPMQGSGTPYDNSTSSSSPGTPSPQEPTDSFGRNVDKNSNEHAQYRAESARHKVAKLAEQGFFGDRFKNDTMESIKKDLDNKDKTSERNLAMATDEKNKLAQGIDQQKEATPARPGLGGPGKKE